MTDWEAFVESVPWFVDAGSNVSFSDQCRGLRLSRTLNLRFPALSRLLASADVTPVSINDAAYYLLAWNSSDGERIGWLCFPPASKGVSGCHDDHNDLLKSFGGIVERFNEPADTWLLNHNDVLTAREAVHDASVLNDYVWAFEDTGGSLPIRPMEYHSIAREANGNTTFCHRTTGSVILFTPDHSFDFVTPLDGCPEYTLYTINGIVDFRDWVEAVASQWLAHTKGIQS